MVNIYANPGKLRLIALKTLVWLESQSFLEIVTATHDIPVNCHAAGAEPRPPIPQSPRASAGHRGLRGVQASNCAAQLGDAGHEGRRHIRGAVSGFNPMDNVELPGLSGLQALSEHPGNRANKSGGQFSCPLRMPALALLSSDICQWHQS